MSSGPFLYPQVTSLPGQIQPTERKNPADQAKPGEFDELLGKAIEGKAPVGEQGLGLTRNPLKFSTHAMQRLQERKMQLDAKMMERLNGAVDKAASKGLEDALVLADGQAFIVSVKNRTVITALDSKAASGNVFTNIDGAVIA